MNSNRDTASWAFWRRVWYGTGFGLFWLLVFSFVYVQYIYTPATCFDGSQNGNELGIDCGGGCNSICSLEIEKPNIRWSQSFKIRDGQYNVVAYVENQNKHAGTLELSYKFSLYDDDGLITEIPGSTILPPDSIYPIFVGPILTHSRIPNKTFIELDSSKSWLPASKGRNQFSIVERKLTGADSRPRLEVKIINNELTPSNNIEIVATIFDTQGNALTSSRTFVEYFAPQAEQTVVFTWPEPIAKTLRSCEVPTDVVVAVDLSGSMNNDQANPPEPISSVLRAADSFVSRLKIKDQSAVITFASDAITQLSLTNNVSSVQNKIKGLSILPKEETGSTNTGDAFIRAKEIFKSSKHNQSARKVMVILTDGLATAPENNPEEYAKEKAQYLKDSGVEVYAIGLGKEVNMDFVNSIATDRNYAFQSFSRGQVDKIYKTITKAICEDGPAVIDIIPKTGANFISS